jgi:glycosyltransferase involved in cell wall biosynthesis/multidrug transporter EmrE-like cation transporter
VNVLVVSSYPPRRCGVGAYARDQVEWLRSEGQAVMVLSPPDGEGDVRVPFLGGRAFFRAAGLGGRFDRMIVHFQPALYYRPRAPFSKVLTSLALLYLTLRRRDRMEILVHEADPPVRWRPDYVLLRRAFARARLVFHTEAERRTLERDYRVRVEARVVPHRLETARLSREEARRRLGLSDADGSLFVCAGFLQPSKGFDRAVRAFAGVDAGARLFVVGSMRERTPENEAYVRDLREACVRVPGVALVERFVADEEFDQWVAAADWLVVPYRRSWSSGVLARAQALGTPAIVAAVGGLPEQAGGDDVVFADDPGLEAAMRDASRNGRTVSDGRPRREDTGTEMASEAGGSSPRPTSRTGEHRSAWDPFYEPPIPKDLERRGRTMLLGLILLSVLLAALAQLTLKHGMNQVSMDGATPLSLSQPGETIRRIASNVSVWAGLATFAISAGIWMVVLSRTSLSFAYPFASLTYVLILLFDRLVLKDQVPALRWGGVALIIGGILLVSRTPHN